MIAIQAMHFTVLVLVQVFDPLLAMELKGFFLGIEVDNWYRRPVAIQEVLFLVEKGDNSISEIVEVGVIAGGSDSVVVSR